MMGKHFKLFDFKILKNVMFNFLDKYKLNLQKYVDLPFRYAIVQFDLGTTIGF